MIRATVLVTAVALCFAGCATTEKVLGGDGASCQAPADCEKGFTCKASRCTPHQSRVGEVCVTDKGCEAGLFCLQGSCSTGRASADGIARACQHLRGLMEAASRMSNTQTDQTPPDAQFNVEMAAFALECRERLTASGTTVEKAACIESVTVLDQVQGCP